MTMDYLKSNPFTNFSIYEYKNRTSFLNKNSISFTSSIEGKKMKSSFKYLVNNYYTNYIAKNNTKK